VDWGVRPEFYVPSFSAKHMHVPFEYIVYSVRSMTGIPEVSLVSLNLKIRVSSESREVNSIIWFENTR